VVDVGCGVGPWLRAAADRGIDDYLGIDGDWVPADRLAIPADRLHTHDLREPLRLDREFDLAICVEVAEHLPDAAAPTLVATLTRLAPVILFSAAVPDQGGDGHINEQWPAYWAELFAEHGYAAHDRIRLPVWLDDRADWWYRQNVLLYVDRTRRPPGLGEPVDVPPALIHPEMIHAILTRAPADARPAAPTPLAAPPPPAPDRPAPRRPTARGTAGGAVVRRLGTVPAAARSGWHRVRRAVRRVGGAGR
jgi:SAM-dependent methyltransferase